LTTAKETVMFTNTKAFGGFAVDDVPKAKKFYAETLGLRVSEEYGMLSLHIASWLSAQPLKVSTNQLPVPKVLFPERLLQRMLFSQNLPVDDPSHDRKRCDHPRVSRDKCGSEIEQGPTYIHRVATDGVGPSRN
jgi:catechol 2,3-dioxygenase-like lactoylglutathione lyase family enzyme